jgi:hypothetical protein
MIIFHGDMELGLTYLVKNRMLRGVFGHKREVQ